MKTAHEETALEERLAWPLERLGEALGLLAHGTGLIPQPIRFPVTPKGLGGSRTDLRRWIVSAAETLDVDAEPFSLSFEDTEKKLGQLAPAVLRLPSPDGDLKAPPRFLAIESCRKGRAVVLDPDLGRRTVDMARVADLLRQAVHRRHGDELRRLLDDAGVESRRDQVYTELLRQRLGQQPIAVGWLLRLPPSAPILQQAREAGLGRILLLFVGAYIPKIVAWLGAWWFLWKGALNGQPDWGWLVAWILVLYTNLPFRLLEPWFGALFSINVGWIMKRRLLSGSLRLEPEEIRHQGTGQLLGRTIESEAAEELSLTSGMLIISHTVDLFLTFPLLLAGAGGAFHAMALLVWSAACFGLLRRYFVLRRRWTEMRLDATHQLVEQMVGHQTRLAQEIATFRHTEDDAALEGYVQHSRKMDRMAATIRTVVPGGWLVLSLLILTPAVMGGDFTTAALALSLGGTLFAAIGLELLALGLVGSADAVVAWGKAIDLFRAAARPKVRGVPELALGYQVAAPAQVDEVGDSSKTSETSKISETNQEQPLVEGCDLIFGYRGRGEPVIQKCDFAIHRGDRVLLEGPSGGGKSTLLSLMLGLRHPDSGLLFLDGLDRPSLGDEGWRRRVAAAPQFHENHVFLGTFAFNLLMGREWPPEPNDFAEAEAVCRELGLGPLLERMPGGILQMVGETGWQLSHGEKSRLYIARALLQRADLLAFDESFAALDPENLDLALKAVLARASTVVVIAHP